MAANLPNSVEFRWSKPKLIRMAGLLLCIGALGFLMLGEDGLDVQALGLAWMMSFAWGAWSVLRRRSDLEPVVVVSAEGLRDRRIKDGAVPWAAISSVETMDAEHVPFVGLEFHDPAHVLADAKFLMRVCAPVNRLLRFPSASAQMSLLDGSGEDLIEAIRAFRPDLISGQN